MKTLLNMICLIILCSIVYSQDSVAYKVRYKPLPIQEKPEGKVLIKVPRNKTITILSYNRECGCFIAKYRDIQGIVNSNLWINDIYAPSNGKRRGTQDSIIEGIRRLLHEHELNTQRKANEGFMVDKDQEKAASDLERKAELIRKYGFTDGTRILERNIWLGMHVDMALDSWGIPYRVNRSIGDWGVREQWIYSDAYLYFENGLLTEIFRIK